MGLAVLDDRAWQQAVLPQRLGGLGLPACENVADAAYVSSRLQSHDAAVKLLIQHDRDHGMDGDMSDPWYEAATQELDRRSQCFNESALAKLPVLADDEARMNEKTQKALSLWACGEGEFQPALERDNNLVARQLGGSVCNGYRCVAYTTPSGGQ